MRKISIFSLTILLLTACHPAGQDPGKPAPQPRTQAQIDNDELQPMMEKKGVIVPVLLTPVENDGLKKAIASTAVARDSAISHIHADVQDGKLVFVPESSQVPSHVTEDAPRITVGGGNPRTVAVVATPAAKQLLEQRTSQTH